MPPSLGATTGATPGKAWLNFNRNATLLFGKPECHCTFLSAQEGRSLGWLDRSALVEIAILVPLRLLGDHPKLSPKLLFKPRVAAIGLSGLLGAILAALPAEAGQLLNWRFDPSRNQLSFTTDEGVQPRAQILSGPDRLVIELPDTSLGRPGSEQRYNGWVRAVRSGQPTRNAARIVIELQPGYRINPNAVRVRSLSPTRWTVDLGTPIATQPAPVQPRPSQRPQPDQPSDRPWVPGALREALERSPSREPLTQIEGLDLSEAGLVLQVNGGNPAVSLERSSDRRQITIILENATIANGIDRIMGGRAGVARLIVTPVRSTYPAYVRVLLVVDPSTPDWQVRTEGTLVIAQPIGSNTAVNPPQPITPPRTTWPRQPQPPVSGGWPPDDLPTGTGGPLPTINRRVRIVVDPGHGGRDPGAIGIGGLQEKQAVLDISLQLAALLRRQGADVVLTRDDDTFISLDGRTTLANRLNATAFVSVHANSAGINRPDVNGLETYYHQSGGRMAQAVHGSIIQAFPYMRNRGVRTARFYVLRHSRMPSILVETGFVTGSQDAALLSNPSWRSQMAWAIARGVINYLNGDR